MTGTVQRALNQGRALLAGAGVAGADTDARYILAAILGLTPDRVILHLADAMEEEAEFLYLNAVHARIGGTPVSHILGGRWFYGRWFEVTPDVLDPRPETETLIEAALAAPFDRVLDLGTGSGCILLTLLAERRAATGLGVDLSDAALQVARANRAALGLKDRAVLRASDWFADVEGQFDLIVSNPPYISAAEYDALVPGVRDHEPRMALTPGGDGLDAYRAIAAGLRAHLAPGGRVMAEIGPGQAEQVTAIFRGAGLVDPACHPDMDGRDRVIAARAP